MNWFNKLKEGLSKSSSKISEGLNSVIKNKKLDQDTLNNLEDLLITTDMGVEFSSKIINKLAKERFDKEISKEEISVELAKIIEEEFIQHIKPPCQNNHQPIVYLICGVNGTGKTTSIGKLAKLFKDQGKSVMLAACDTFRAAATEQLETWARRNDCPIVKGEENSDPASVAYNSFVKAKEEKIDILLIDTAGRLHNKSNLMDELAKISRVLKKIDETAPHENILVIDASTGQNAYSQLEKFKTIIDINKLIVTKLDGTAKAGVIIGLVNRFKIEIFAIGIGEKIDDLKLFNPENSAKTYYRSI